MSVSYTTNENQQSILTPINSYYRQELRYMVHFRKFMVTKCWSNLSHARSRFLISSSALNTGEQLYLIALSEHSALARTSALT